MPEQSNQPVVPSEQDTVVMRIPTQRNGRGYPGTLTGTAAATNSRPTSRHPARSLREALGL